MNKQELVEHVASELDLSKAKAADAIDAVLDGITKAVKKGDEVRLVGFGTFSVKKRAVLGRSCLLSMVASFIEASLRERSPRPRRR